jgi:hypothetical protein
MYAFGLAAGFFGYLAVSLIVAAFVARDGEDPRKAAKTANEFLGE